MLLVLAAVAFASAPLAARPALSTTGTAALSKQLKAAVERGDTPGVVAMVVDKDGEIFSAAAGSFDVGKKVPMPVDAIFNIASMTKPVTSVAIMMLMEEGKLTLDDPVSRHLPVFGKIQVIETFNEADGSFTARPAKKVMTVRHLLTHTSGIGYTFSSPVLAKLQGGGPARRSRNGNTRCCTSPVRSGPTARAPGSSGSSSRRSRASSSRTTTSGASSSRSA